MRLDIKRQQLIAAVPIIGLLGFSALTMTGCEESESEQAVDETADAVEDTADNMADAVGDAADDFEDAVDEGNP